MHPTQPSNPTEVATTACTIRLQDASRDYLSYIRHERGLSKNTFAKYQATLHFLDRWLVENGYPDPTVADFSTPTLRRFMYHISARGLRPRTIHGHFDPIRGLSRFLVANGALQEDVAAPIQLPKKDAAIRKVVTDEEMVRLFEACERQRKPQDVAFSRAVLSVLAFAGLRRAELMDLHVADLNLNEASILVRCGKGSKSRKVFVCAEAVHALKEWMTFRPSDCRHPYVWAMDRNRRMGEERLKSLVEDLRSIAGLGGEAHILPHSIRHNCATRLLRNGADIRSISTFLGHSSLQTTSVYLHTSEEQLRNIAQLGGLERINDVQGTKQANTRGDNSRRRNLDARRRVLSRRRDSN